MRQSFYFVNRSLTTDGRFCWFYAGYPPSADANYGRVLGVVDFEDDEVRVFPETAFLDGSPLIDPRSGEAYWVTGQEIWRRGPKQSMRAQLVNRFPDDLARGRRPYRITTHLTFCADGTSLNIDAQIGRDWYVGDAPMDGTPVRIWQHFTRCYNHGQFSPVDRDLQLIAQDWWIDPATGERGAIDNRMWLIRRGEHAFPILEQGSPLHTHEWWSSDGASVWYVDYSTGTWNVDISSRVPELVWPGGRCHSHATADGRFLVGDNGSYNWANGCRVTFYNTLSGTELNIASSLPLPDIGRDKYHIDPHPQFCCDDQIIAYTTTVGGEVTLALTPVDRLIELTS